MSSFEEMDLNDVVAPDELGSKIETYYRQDIADKLLRAYTWDEAIRFYDGDQHIEYNVSTNRFQQVTISRNNDFIPRPITNYILPSVKTVVSILTKNKPEANVRPNSQDPKDISASKVGDLILDLKYEELREEEKQQEKAYWGVISGTVFKKIYWDETTNKVIRIPKTKQVPKMTTQTVGVPHPERPWETIQQPQQAPATDENGQPIMEEVPDGETEIPVGDVNTVVVPPFNIAFPLNTRSPLEMSWIMEYSVQKIEWIKEQYSKDNGEGYTGEAENVTEEKDLNTVMQLEYRLRTLIGRRSGGHYATGSSGYIDIKNSAVLKEWYQKPNAKFPKGRMVVVANGKTLFVGDSPYYEEGYEDSWNPYVEWRFEIVPGRAWGKGLVDEGVPIQRRINAIDALIILHRRTMAIGQWLLPDGCGVPNGYINGRPGLVIPYRPVGANGAKPEKLQGQALPQQVYQEREQAVTDLKKIMMTADVLEGVNPEGVKTAYQLEQLQENALAMYGATFQRWEKSFEREQEKILLLISRRYKEPRPEFGKKLKAINKDLTDVDLELFIGSDLQDNCSVRVEVGSSIPRSRAGENAVLREMTQNGILDVVKNSINKKELFDRMGIKGFDYEATPDIKRAEWENTIIENGDMQNMVMQPPQIDPLTGQPAVDPNTGQPAQASTVLELDDHISHITIHSARLKDPNVPMDIRQKYLQHIEEHLQFQAKAAQSRMAMGGGQNAVKPGIEGTQGTPAPQ